MTDTSVIEGNKLIAEFMGAKWLFQDDAIYHRYGWFYELDNIPTKWTSLWHDNEHLQYHSSWDWLLPALKTAKQKIKEAGWDKSIQREARSRLQPAFNEVCNINIENAHYCFVKFIEWYNSQKEVNNA